MTSSVEASTSMRYVMPSTAARPTPIDARAPAIGMPAARKPPKTKIIATSAIGRATASPVRRSRSTCPWMSETMSDVPPTIPVAPGAASVSRAGAAWRRECTASRAVCWGPSARFGSSPTTTRNPCPSRATSGAAAGFVGPPGRASGSTTDTTPGTAARSRRIGGIAAATPAETGSTPVSTSVSDAPLWSMRPSRSSAALLCDPGTSGAPDVTLSNTDWPPWIPSPATP